MAKYTVTVRPRAPIYIDATSKELTETTLNPKEVIAASVSEATREAVKLYARSGLSIREIDLTATVTPLLPSWDIYFKAGPLTTLYNLDEEQVLTKLATLADAWGLSVDRFFVERVEG